MNKPTPELVGWMLQAHETFVCQLTSCVDLNAIAEAEPEEMRRLVHAAADSACDETLTAAGVTLSPTERRWITERVLDETFGSGPLEPLLRDADSDAIVILGPRDVCLERDGELRETEVVFADEQHIRRLFERRAGIERYLQRVPGEGGPTWRLDLRKLRERVAQAASEAAATTAPPSAIPAPSRQSGGIGQWLAKLFG